MSKCLTVIEMKERQMRDDTMKRMRTDEKIGERMIRNHGDGKKGETETMKGEKEEMTEERKE